MEKSNDRLSVCIETVFPHTMPYEEQIRTVASLGYSAYEFWYHDMVRDGKGGWLEKENAKDLDLLCRLNEELGLTLVNFALNSPHADHGGTPVDDRGADQMVRELERLLPVCRRLGVLQLITFVGWEKEGLSKGEAKKRIVKILKKLDGMLEGSGMVLTVEPLSRPKYTGCLLPTITEAVDLLREVDGMHIKILYDLFHIQIMTGNIIDSLRESIEYLGHLHVSGIPGQHEPWESELNLPYILNKLAGMGYGGYYGLEYYPLSDPVDSLVRTKEFLKDAGGF
ncbi:MAG: TIM barrel protein [Spirochaetes bacterium]|nr:TIM barrel protein [Spirochaetota bacterium]